MKIKDPISGYSHIVGGILAIVGTIFLLIASINTNQWDKIFPFLIFGLSMIMLYFSSGLYHLFGKNAEEVDIFRKIDHAMIYILIAGTYTPLCLIALKGMLGTASFITIWIIAIFGISTVFFKKFWAKMPRWGSTGIYILMGWISIFLIYPLSKTVSSEGIMWLIIGGAFYTIGAVIYALKKPNPFKGFGFHEIFHIFVLLGTASHFWCIFHYLSV
ncbi:MAG: hemolysin III family protein [Minisyncoccus archaeiphilus]|jgi:hemolysin III|uniref:PAQR family membrane homeostasis protein TrhA n=1 Tax=Minisyncoccus archaeiphilus TaxID=3238481 RepID=UPI002B080BCC|nr:MAG: hemolysin III family protein [Candidatus Parcubacteria bacterium]